MLKRFGYWTFLLCAITPLAAMAGTANLSWTFATQNTDGTIIPASGPESIASTKLEYFQCAAITTAWPAVPTFVSVAKPATTYVFSALTNGVRYCFRARTVLVNGVESDPSGVGSKLVPNSIPNPPVLVVMETVAYKMRQTVDGYDMVAFGKVDLGTACNSAKSVDGYNLVPRAAVKMNSAVDTRPLNAFAKCG